VVITDPGISNTVGYKPYDDGVSMDIFVKVLEFPQCDIIWGRNFHKCIIMKIQCLSYRILLDVVSYMAFCYAGP